MAVEGKVAIVTGAGSGLGEAGARRLAGEGASVVVADRDADGAERVVSSIVADGGTAAPFVVDVADLGQTEALVEFATSTYGRLDLAFNDAGITPALIDVHEIDPADWRAVVDINLTGIFYCVRSEIRTMLEHGGGAIVNMASTAGLMAHAERGAYSASKHGIIGLTRSAAVEYAQRGIRINAVAPGPIGGPSFLGLPAEVQASIAAKTAMGRTGLVEEVAGVVSFLLSDDASFVTGSVYEVNGGQTQL